MRRKKEAVLSFELCDDGLPKVVRDYRNRYRGFSQILDNKDDILSAIHEDIQGISIGGPEHTPFPATPSRTRGRTWSIAASNRATRRPAASIQQTGRPARGRHARSSATRGLPGRPAPGC